MKSWKPAALAAFLILVLAACVPQDQAGEEFRTLLESIYAEDGPGATVVISREGEVRFSGAFGMADLEMGVPMNEDHILRLASVSKQYTAAAILKLAEEGRLSLDDPLERFLPEFPIGQATVHQLLNHTSGIRSYTDIPGYFDGERIRRVVNTAELIDVFVDETPDFEPGEKWRYNNSGYVLLGAIIEEITGQDWDSYIADALLKPAGIERTGYYPDELVLPGRARGYHKDGGSRNAPWISMSQPHAAGALSATALDVDRWQRALHGGEILSPEMLARMTEVEEVAGDYGYGLVMGTLRNRPVIQHGGGIQGFVTFALWLPQERVSVVVLSNYVGHDPDVAPVAQRLAAIAINDPYPAELPTVPMSAAELAAVEGTYRIDRNTTRTLRAADGKLISQRQGGREFSVRPVGDDRFVFADSLSYFEIERDGDGNVYGLHFYQQGEGDPEFAEKISDTVEERGEFELSLAETERLVGVYEIQPGFTLSIRITDGALTGQATGQPAVGLKAAAGNLLYNAQFGLELEFDLGESGPASGLTLRQAGQTISAPRVTN
jgi:CubicO group peptidase (beta-lactamase class C family)